MATDTEIEVVPEPRRETFTEKKLEGEPKSDVKVIAGGLTLRERVDRVETPKGYSLIFTYTRLDSSDAVMTDSTGAPLISDPHEVNFDGEGAGRLGMAEMQKSLKDGRQVAVARAVDHFTGLEQLPSLMASRLG